MTNEEFELKKEKRIKKIFLFLTEANEKQKYELAKDLLCFWDEYGITWDDSVEVPEYIKVLGF